MRAVWIVAGLVACGPSGEDVKTAKTAEYNASLDDMVAVAKQAIEADYKVGGVNQGDCTGDENACTAELITVDRYYGPEGDFEGVGAGDAVHLQKGSVDSLMIVALHRTGPHTIVVEVIPKTFQFIGTPKPRELAPDDPNLPPFIHGRVDALSFKIYELGRKFVAPTAPH